MPITNLLEQNCKLYPEDCALVEINPAKADDRRVTWREYDLVQSSHAQPYRREITWRVFNEKANRFANLLLERGIGKDDKVGILLMRCHREGDCLNHRRILRPVTRCAILSN